MPPRYRRTEAEWKAKYDQFAEHMRLARERGLLPPLPEPEPEDGES
jgi:hypothetical protein